MVTQSQVLEVNPLKEGVISTGMRCLDPLIGGGFRHNTVNIVIADSGCGKSTMCWQYTSSHLHQPVLFISLEEDLPRILREARSIGISDFERKLKNKSLHFVYAAESSQEITSGEFALNFLLEELPKYLDLLKGASMRFPGGLKIVIDPLTPILFEIQETSRQRDALNRIFQLLRGIGTSLISLERGFGESLLKVPIFLSDSVISLDFLGLGSEINRTLHIRKFRSSAHSEAVHPIKFRKGVGLVVSGERG